MLIWKPGCPLSSLLPEPPALDTLLGRSYGEGGSNVLGWKPLGQRMHFYVRLVRAGK